MRQRFLDWLAAVVVSRPRRILIGALALTVALGAVALGLEVKAGHSSMFSSDDPHHRRLAEFQRWFGSPNVLFVVVDGGSRDARRRVIDGLAARLPRRPRSDHASAAPAAAACRADGPANQAGCVRGVIGRIDIDQLTGRALLHAPVGQVRALVSALSDEQLGLKRIFEVEDLAGLLALAAGEIERRMDAPPPTGEAAGQAATAMSLFARLVDDVRQRLTEPGRAGLPLEDTLLDSAELTARSGIDPAGYFTSRDGKLALSLVRPVHESDEPSVVGPFVEFVQRQAAAAVAELACCTTQGCPDGPLRVRLTGLPALVADERAVLARDLPLTSTVAAVGILLLFVFAFRSLRQGLLGMLPLVAALVCTLGFVRLTIGGLNMVTAACIPTMLGLGIDFFVHLLARFNEARWRGDPARAAIQIAIRRAGPGIITGAVTTAGAFFALAINRFKGFSDLGVITAVGLLFCLAALVVTAAAMSLPGRVGELFSRPPPPRRPVGVRGNIGTLVVQHRYLVLLAGVAISVAMVWRAPGIPWSYNYLELLPAERPSVVAMLELARRTDFSGEIAAVDARSLAETERLAAALRQQPTVGRVESVEAYLPRGQREKIAALSALRPLLAGLGPPAWKGKVDRVDLQRLGQALQELSDNLEDARFEAGRGNHPAAAQLAPLARAAASLRDAFEQLRADPTARQRLRQRATALQRELFAKLDKGRAVLEANVAARPQTVEALLASLPDGVRQRLYARADGSARFALYVYPRSSVWDGDLLPRFVGQVRAVKDDATGFTVTHWEATLTIRKGFRDASVLAFAVLVVLLLVDFRSLRLTALALVPLVLGIGWMLGGMSLVGMSYNFANVIAFPLIIGIGVTSGVHILHRYRQEGYVNVADVVHHTGMAILLSAATTMMGFGSLALAQHHGAAALGWLLLMGVASCLVAATLVLPALLSLRRPR